MFLRLIRTRRVFEAALLSAALLFLLTFSALSPAQDLARRLILKDGSYQLVTKYEVKGNRVRYLSAERNEWEELPESLVDWPATQKYEKDRAAGASVPEAAQLDKELEREREQECSEVERGRANFLPQAQDDAPEIQGCGQAVAFRAQQGLLRGSDA